MRSLAIIATLLLLAGCGDEGSLRKPLAGRLYFPTAVVHVPTASGGGRLVVANSNFDNRYDYGSVTSIDLAALGLPAFGAPVTQVAEVTDLKLPAGSGGVQGAQERLIETFASADVGVYPTASGARLFIPTRGGANRLHGIDVNAATGAVTRSTMDTASPAATCPVRAMAEPPRERPEP